MRREATVTNLFPMFLKLDQKPCLIVGAGRVGEPKIGALLGTGARILVVAIEASALVHEWAAAGRITLELRAFAPRDLDGNFLVVVATASRSLNQAIYREARRCGVLCNVVDVPELCDFFYPAVVRRGDLQIAISTAGKSPSLAQKLRQQLERQFGPAYEAWVRQLGETRELILRSDLDKETKSELLHSLAGREAFEAALARISVVEPEFSATGDSV
jgi:precorrin-2 dehydrogenase / sirohydrochlorin ferrochelatase